MVLDNVDSSWSARIHVPGRRLMHLPGSAGETVSTSNFVNPFAIAFKGSDPQLFLFDELAADESAYAVRLPTSRGDDRLKRRAAGFV